jgi:ubiquinone/menaquinone biosynthesis C-methylase UbiE
MAGNPMNSSDLPPLHTQAPTERFSSRAEDYAKHRPTYPPEAIAQALANLGDPANLTAADIGAGTGISARLLADQGVQVIAIEPNAAMRSAAAFHPQVEFRAGTAEQTGLADQAIDLVLCCQSFHWFNQPVALAEFHRILKPSRRIALIWNDRDETDPFTQAHGQTIRQFSERRIYDNRRKAPDALANSPLFAQFRSQGFQHRQWLDREGLIGLALSASYAPPAATAQPFIASLNQLCDRWADATDQVSLAYRTYLYLAESLKFPLDC